MYYSRRDSFAIPRMARPLRLVAPLRQTVKIPGCNNMEKMATSGCQGAAGSNADWASLEDLNSYVKN